MELARRRANALEDAVERELEALDRFDPVREAEDRLARMRQNDTDEDRLERKRIDALEREVQIREEMVRLEEEKYEGTGNRVSSADLADKKKELEQRLDAALGGADAQAAAEVGESRRSSARKQEEDRRRLEVARRKSEMPLNEGENRADVLSAEDKKALGAGTSNDIRGLLQKLGLPGAGGTVGRVGSSIENLMGLGEGGSAGGMLGSAGPIGAAIMLAKEAADKIAGVMDFARKGVEMFGTAVADAAGNRYMGTFNRAIDAASSGLEQVPIIGKVWSSELQLAVAPVRSFTEVVDAFVTRGKELSGYSGDLASAEATSDVNRLMADIKEAQTLGPDMARLIESQTRFELAFRDLVEPIKKWLLEKLAGIMETAAEFMEYVQPSLEVMRIALLGLLEVTKKGLEFDGKGAVKVFIETQDAINRFADAWAKKNADEHLAKNPLLEAFMGLGTGPADSSVQGGPDTSVPLPPLIGGF